jgi:hypothetical protein
LFSTRNRRTPEANRPNRDSIPEPRLRPYYAHEVDPVPQINIVKKIKVDGEWKLLAIPRNAKGNYDWNGLPDGFHLIEWRWWKAPSRLCLGDGCSGS